MEPKDLRNSSDELKATPEQGAAISQESQGLGAETDKTPENEPMPDESASVAGEANAAADTSDNPETPDQETAASVEEDPEKDHTDVSEGEEVPENTGEPGNGENEYDEATAEAVMANGETDHTDVSEGEEVPENNGEPGNGENEHDEATAEAVMANRETGHTNVSDGEKVPENTDEPGSGEDEYDEATAEAVMASGKIDYSGYSEVELINALRELISRANDEDLNNEDLKNEVDRIRISFYKKHKAVVAEEKMKFLAEGGDENDFVAGNALYEEDLKNLLKEYRQLKSNQLKQMDEDKEKNLQIKYEIIEEIKSLVNRKESINKTFQEFRELQQKWRDTGLVPQSKLKDLWETYHHHVENFYDYIKINKELRDLDLKKNLEAKINLCEKAEELLMEPSAIKAFNILQKYHEQWREIGPVPREKKDELWERFKAATSTINKNHQEYFEERKKEQKKNLDAKTALCEKAEEIASLDLKTHKEWDEKSRELIELQKVWRTVGFTPKRDNNRIYERFRIACDKFFDAKREFYAQNKELQVNNLQLKTDLCVQAEALKDSTDWKKTTDEFIRIQKKWKEVGPVPRKQSDAVWKRFRSACDYFFDQKSRHFSVVDHEQEENLRLKRELIEEVKNYQVTWNEHTDLEQMKEFQRRWTEIGHVPFKEKDIIQNEFREAVNVHFDHLKIDDQKRNLLKFKSKMSNFSSTNRGQNKMRFERDKYVVRLKQLENDLALLNNNIGFFANTKNAESLIDDVNKKILSTREKIEFLKEKIRIIDEMEDED